MREQVLARLRDQKEKVEPPFPALPAFSLDALILSFVGYSDEIAELLNLLNTNT